MYRNTNGLQGNSYSYDVYHDTNDERFLLAPLVVGGLAGTALGFGIANNNQLNNARSYRLCTKCNRRDNI